MVSESIMGSFVYMCSDYWNYSFGKIQYETSYSRTIGGWRNIRMCCSVYFRDDYAKILYAISGYDNFNSNFFNIISLNKNNSSDLPEVVEVMDERIIPETYSITFKINPFVYDKKIIDKYFNKVHKAYMVIIWLSLAEYNKNNIWKCIASYYYGLYLGTIL
jgi:hypothetical protein